MTTGLDLDWRNSTFSGDNGACVEVATLPDGGQAVRDSKDGGTDPVLCFGPAEWRTFVAGAKGGEFD